jgi:hypothetical protein
MCLSASCGPSGKKALNIAKHPKTQESDARINQPDWQVETTSAQTCLVAARLAHRAYLNTANLDHSSTTAKPD